MMQKKKSAEHKNRFSGSPVEESLYNFPKIHFEENLYVCLDT